MGGAASTPLTRGPVPAGKTRICVSGFSISHHTSRARALASAIAEAHPEKYESWFYFDVKGYRDKPTPGGFLKQIKSELSKEQQDAFAAHKTSPFCWLELPDGSKDAKGGRDFFAEWAAATFTDEVSDKEIRRLATTKPSLTEGLFWDSKSNGTAQRQG
jgi:hypothetical protein